MKDLLVVGGGPVGLAAATMAARAGLDVAVLEARPLPVDKACGEGLMPGAWRAVRHVLRERADGLESHDLTGIRYLDVTGRSVEAAFRSGPGRGVRRLALHGALADAAVAAGVDLRTARVGEVAQDAACVTAGGERARYLLAADGLHSRVRAGLGLERPAPGPPRYGLRHHFAVAPWTSHVEVHWAAHAEAYVTPVAPDVVGVAVLSAQRRPFEQHLAAFPELLARLGGAPAVDDVRGAGPLRQRASARTAGRVLLVGDAAGYVDALTGEGIAVGLASARAAVDAVLAGRPHDYERAWRRASRRYRWLTAALLWAATHHRARGTVVPAAQRLPRAFGAVVDQLAR
ncbi:MAG: NAD(P)/FAD-dependent oxidoreductase [Angustibacter sp.]